MPSHAHQPESKLHAVNLRMRTETRSLIDHAAMMLGRSRSDFVIEAARRAAEDAILDQTIIEVSRERYEQFLEMLDRPPQPNAKLRATMQAKPLWQQP
ncbi:MAG: DUF1778 domain-containing protein [Azonexus sp.]|jgi:uncharacterized protein (DUF1778 family)|uniref:type II toxin-antitoxin system TacA family antitoxin n=1 Tax=Azonexus sp. TaxID=1872668 RepID=UPI0028310BD8|nr:DUF1778 domain-containing protein [Azonexus sp.]MDR0776222.1 DUF1778 domain-containing protein [Azonexus sp.]